MKRVSAIGAALLLLPLLVRLLLAQSPPPSQAPPPPPTYTLTDLGPLNITAAPSGATALNASGQVTGFSFENFPSQVCFAAGANRAFLWLPQSAYGLPAGMNDLGTLGGASSSGYGMNSTGQIVGTADLCLNNASAQRAFTWQNGTMSALDPSTNPSDHSAAFAINTNGDVAGYINHTSAGVGYQPIFWKGGTAAGATVLSTLPCQFGSCQGEALAINDSGQAAGWSQAGGGGVHPVVWEANGQPTDLGTFSGTFISSANQANAINANGVVAGYSQLDPAVAPSTVHAFSWTNGSCKP